MGSLQPFLYICNLFRLGQGRIQGLLLSRCSDTALRSKVNALICQIAALLRSGKLPLLTSQSFPWFFDMVIALMIFPKQSMYVASASRRLLIYPSGFITPFFFLFSLFLLSLTVGALRSFVKSHLADPDISFYLCKLCIYILSLHLCFMQE